MSAVWWLALAAFAAATLGVALFAWRQRRRAATDEHACCGRCGYPITGLPTSVCPECGADRNVVGVRQPTWWNRQTPVRRRTIRFAVWTLWMATLTGLLWPPFANDVLPATIDYTEVVDFWPQPGQYAFWVRRTWHIEGWGWQVNSWPPAGTRPAEWFVLVQPNLSSDASFLLGLVPEQWTAHGSTKLFAVQSAKGTVIYDDPSTDACLKKTTANWEPFLATWSDALASKWHEPTLPNRLQTALKAAFNAPPRWPRGTYLPGLEKGSSGWSSSPSLIWSLSPPRRDLRYAPLLIVPLVAIWLLGCWLAGRVGQPDGATSTPVVPRPAN